MSGTWIDNEMIADTNNSLSFDAARRIVVKVGSNVLTEDNGLNLKAMRSITRQISKLIEGGLEVILVSSGAMASGIKKIGLSARPDELPKRQAVAAVGQAGLMMEYEKAFGRHKLKVAQILLTSEDLSNRKRYLNARNTLNTLLAWQVVPIINENDTVWVEEIMLGDNDNLAAMITLLMDADLLINLTDIDGLFTRDPRVHADAQLIDTVTRINKDTERYAGDIPGALGTGGMISKIKAARKVNSAGVPMVIAKGDKPNILLKLYSGQQHGTFFIPRKQRLTSRKCWIAYSLKPRGTIIIDDGAVNAILNNGKSLLPSGIISVQKEFGAGAAVEFQNQRNQSLGIGLVNYSSIDIDKIKGLKSNRIKQVLGHKSYDEIIHRDNLAITTEDEI
ncbi:Glutamate 5-kinase (EC / RNA-binding C-terminal domain PUA [Olavius algarvensis Delta 1 endosymbiont]|nr:Glutamate 5-kinase (EC / RNA-binding C-terminal domain PUA [Olavius algarvensis Delta 1 endosymbiont]